MKVNDNHHMRAHTCGRLRFLSFLMVHLSLLLLCMSVESFIPSSDNLLAAESFPATQENDVRIPVRPASVLSRELVQVAQQARVSVVNITIKTKSNNESGQFELFPFLDNPFPRRLYENPTESQEEIPLLDSPEIRTASGVIIRSDGYIITNNHVVDQAYDIRIQLADQRIMPAQIIGQDPQTDLAVLKIEAENLPVVHWGDSGHLQVGEIVVAVGNPVGLNQIVTMGIVSAVGQGNFDHVDMESFIQTDATVIPGNSGGALLNLQGELIGINTALLRDNRSEMGIGFAIPSQMAKTVSTMLIQKGTVTRGWIGVATQKLTPELEIHLKNSGSHGVLVTEFDKNGPAGRAQFQQRDIILSYRGTPIDEPRQLQSLVAETKPGTSVMITRIHDGQEQTVAVTIEEFPFLTISTPSSIPIKVSEILAGVTVEPIPKDFARGKDGLLVSAIVPGSLSDTRGLEEGDVILEINQIIMHSVKDFKQVQATLGLKDRALLFIRREQVAMFLAIHKD